MTLLPVEQVRIGKGHLPGTLPVTGQCMNPVCYKAARDAHHIVRRSHLAGAYRLVEIDGAARPNIAFLCGHCHDALTRNEAKVAWAADEWCWEVADNATTKTGLFAPLNPQPFIDPFAGVSPAHEPGAGGGRAPQDTGVPAPSAPAPGTSCPTCNRRIRPVNDGTNPKRQKKTIGIAVPKDERENGVEVWKEHYAHILNDPDIRELGYDEETPPYFVLVAVMHGFCERAVPFQ